MKADPVKAGAGVKTYVRPMGSWWLRNPFYRWYMLRELSCAFITAYALILLRGLMSLTEGREAFDAWRGSLGSPWAVGFHVIALLMVTYHAWTWFKVMPKTLPFVSIAGRRLSDRTIIALGLAAACAASILVFLAVFLNAPQAPP
jgi:fumarate reductase subunit C